MEPKRLFLLDAYALIFRAYYALIQMPRLTADGFNTSAVFGFVNTLEDVLRNQKPSHLAVCFDPQGPTFRSEAYEKYKSERAATPEDIRLSVPVIKDIVRAYRIPLLEVEGFEADDVIGTMAVRASGKGFTTYMMTPDKDFGQLVSPSVLQFKPAYRGADFELRGEEEVCARYGLQRTSQVIDLLALMGDKVDNIPGCPGVGEKTAVRLISEFGDVDSLLANTDRLKGALRRKVEENAEQIRFSRFLATIRTDVPVDAEPDDLAVREPDRDKLFEIFRKLEFRNLTERVSRRLDETYGPRVSGAVPEAAPRQTGQHRGEARQLSLFDDLDDAEGTDGTATLPAPAPDAVAPDFARMARGLASPEGMLEPKWTEVTDTAAIDSMQTALGEARAVGMATVTEGDNDVESLWTGTALALPDGRAWFVPSSFTEGVAAVLDLMARPDICKVTPQAKLDMLTAARRRAALSGDTEAPRYGDCVAALAPFYDVTLAHYVLQPDLRHSIEFLAQTLLDVALPPAAAPLPKGKARAGVDMEARAAVTARRACAEAWCSLLLRPVLERDIEAEGMTDLLERYEMPLVAVLASMELAGVRIDVEALDAAARDMEGRLADIEHEIWRLAGEEFNVGSPAKVGEILFGKLGLDPKAKKTRTGQYSTGEEILEKLTPKHPIVGKILEYRQFKKLLTTYLTALPAAINPATGKVHTNYNQTVTATGRISSSNPNLQNIPVRDELGRGIREAFIADPGHLFLSADYSQIELRLVADFADDGTMIEAFREGRDIHAITAARIYHKSPDEVTADERRSAKTANFGILYGISAFGLASRLGIPRGEAKELIDNYFATFPTIRRYMEKAVEDARAEGFVSTRIGRKRRLPDINSRNPVVRGYAERNAINAPIQGSAADIIKRAMIDIAREMHRRGLKSRMIMQVHDELNFDVVPDELPVMQELVTRLMQQAYDGRVTLTAEAGVGVSWLDAH